MPVPRTPELINFIRETFNLAELEDLCTLLDVNYEELKGSTLGGKAHELVRYMKRRGRLPELLEAVERARPDLFAEHFPQPNGEGRKRLPEETSEDGSLPPKGNKTATYAGPLVLFFILLIIIVGLNLVASRAGTLSWLVAATSTHASTVTPSIVSTSTSTSMPTATSTARPSGTPTLTPTSTATATRTAIPTSTITPTGTATSTMVPTSTLDPSPTPFGGGNGVMLFVSGSSGSEDIYKANLRFGQGVITNHVPLTQSPQWMESFPQCSPNGSQVAFAFSGDKGVRYTISTMDIAGQNRNELTGTGLIDSKWPSWAPDGNHLVFSGRSSLSDDYEIYIYDLVEQELEQLTDNSVSDAHPSVSPDGRQVAYDSGNAFTDIWVIEVSTKLKSNLTQGSEGVDSRPVWSPSGRQIAFESDDTNKPEIYIMNSDGTGRRRLTDTEGMSRSPAWSPDGSLVIFESAVLGSYHIMAVSAYQSGEPFELTNTFSSERFPSWCPSYQIGP